MLSELFEDFHVNPKLVAVVRKGRDENTSELFTVGQSAIDGGFAVPYSAAEVVEELNDLEYEMDHPEEDEDGEEGDQGDGEGEQESSEPATEE